MSNPWFISIVSSLIAAAIWYVLGTIFKRIATREPEIKQHGSRIAIFSICVSTIVFMFGNILQPAVQSLMEPGIAPYFQHLELLAEQIPGIMLVMLFVLSLLPGIVTGLGCSKGRSLNQRLWFAIASAIVSLTILDSVIFFSVRPQLLALEIPEIRFYTDIGYYYFCLLSNLTGGVVAGLIVGSTTHLLAGLLSKEAQGVTLN